MAVIIPDLTKSVTVGGIELNAVEKDVSSGKPVLFGGSVDMLDVSDVDVVQFTEKLALEDGIDYGGVWLGARRPVMKGTVYGRDRAEVIAKLEAMDAVMTPVSGTFGLVPLTFWAVTFRTIQVRPNGLRVAGVRDREGGDDSDPVAIQWSLSMLAPRPAIA